MFRTMFVSYVHGPPKGGHYRESGTLSDRVTGTQATLPGIADVIGSVRLQPDRTERCLFHQSCWRPFANPPLGLVLGLSDEHIEPPERLAASHGRLFQQPG